MVKAFQKLIDQHHTIILFRHLDGDGDALGSQWGLYYYLKEKYPKKEIYAVGDESLGYKHLFPAPQTLSDDKFKAALAIVLDSANQPRISDQRYKLANKIVKIDHHVPVDSYGDLEIVDDTISSCGELLTNILAELEDNHVLSERVASYLYMAIISDTINFSIPNVTAKTFETASYLAKSEIEIATLTQSLNEIDLNLFLFKGYLTNNIVFSDNIAYLIINYDDLEKYNLTISEVKRFVGLMRNINGINIWALIIQQAKDTDLYSVSLRSNAITINDIANNYGGGGHRFASGIKDLSKQQIDQLLKDLIIRVKQ